MAILVQIDAWDPVESKAVTMRVTDQNDPAVCMLGGEVWWPAILKAPSLQYDLFDGAFGNAITSPSSTLQILTEAFPAFGRYALANARLQLWTGKAGDDLSAYAQRLDGRVSTQPKIEDLAASIDVAADSAWLDAPLLSTYLGTSGPEGSDDLTGTPKPLCIGAPRYVPGVLIDSVNSVFQLSGYGAIGMVEAALDQLSRFSDPLDDYPTYDALVAANIPAGRWATALAVGMVRLGAPPAGKVSFLVRGDVAGPNGWVRTPGQIIRRIALLSGGAGKIDDASLDALDRSRPWNLSIYVGEQTTARELIQSLAQSINATAGVSWMGKLFVAPVAIGAPSLALRSDGATLPAVVTLPSQQNVDAPWWRLAVQALRCWNVHDLTDIAFEATLTPRGQYSELTNYREGNIVTLPNGSQFLYTATTPGVGHPLPVAPSIKNDWWFQLQAATTAADVQYASGETLEDLKPAQAGADVTGENIALDVKEINKRPVADVIADLEAAMNAGDLNAQNWQSLAQLIDTRNALMLARTTLDGRDMATVVTDVQSKADNAVEQLHLIGAVNADGSAFLFNLGTVQVDGGQTLAQYVSQIGATSADAKTQALSNRIDQVLYNNDDALSKQIDSVKAIVGDGSSTGLLAQVAFLRQATIDANGNAEAKAVIALDANGKIAGIIATNNGSYSAFETVFSVYDLKTPDGVSLFYASGNTVKMPNVEVDTLKIGSGGSSSQPVFTSSTNSVSGQGVGTWFDVPNAVQSVTLSNTGTIMADIVAGMSFPNGDHTWNLRLVIDGVAVFSVGGQKTSDSVSLSGSLARGAGSYVVKLQMNADSSVSIANKFVRAWSIYG